MKNRMPRLTALLATLTLLASACGDDTDSSRGPGATEGSVMSIVTTTEAVPTTGTPTVPSPAGTNAPRESGKAAVTTTVTTGAVPTLPEFTATDITGTVPVPGESTPVAPVVTVVEQEPGSEPSDEAPSREKQCESSGGVWEKRAGECSYPPAEDDESEVWRPELQEESFAAINPWAAGVDIWYEEKESLSTAPHRFYRFYHMRGDEQTVMWRHWRRTLDVFWDTPFIYYPVRYDLSWHEHPDTVKVVATWPLGEQRELLVTDGAPLAEIELPTGPPLARTTPYTEPDFPETAALLGRDCPPVEQLWSLDAPVEDPCTLEAVRTAFQFAHAAATPQQIRAAVRDGHVLTETIAQIKEIGNQDSFFAYWFDPANPGHYLAEARNVRWAGRFPGASMISAEFRLYARPGLAPPEMQVLARAKIQEQVEAGAKLSDWALADELPTEPPPPEVGFWDRMMVVRTADGTWRMSYPMWCFSMERKTLYESVSCPDDPNPVWSDSIWDFDLYPPNHLDFWFNATPKQREYLGVPPS